MFNKTELNAALSALSSLTSLFASKLEQSENDTAPAPKGKTVKTVNKQALKRSAKAAPAPAKTSAKTAPAPRKTFPGRTEFAMDPKGNFELTADSESKVRVPRAVMDFLGTDSIVVAGSAYAFQPGKNYRAAISVKRFGAGPGDVLQFRYRKNGTYAVIFDGETSAPAPAPQKAKQALPNKAKASKATKAAPAPKETAPAPKGKTVKTTAKTAPAPAKFDSRVEAFMAPFVEVAVENKAIGIANENYSAMDVRHYLTRSDRKAFNRGLADLARTYEIDLPLDVCARHAFGLM